MIYFIQEHNNPNGLIKIGKTVHLERRLGELQNGSPVPLDVIGKATGEQLKAHIREWPGCSSESAIHRRFDADRIRGEWFFPSADLLAFIKTINS